LPRLREIAKLLSDEVRQVITIGTPFAGSADSTNVGLFCRLLNGQKAVLEPTLARRIAGGDRRSPCAARPLMEALSRSSTVSGV
jgi:hypothetical protein